MARVGLVQMNSATKLSENLAFVEQMIIKAYEQQVSLLVLPENFACMGFNNDSVNIAEVYGQGAIQERLSQWAKQYNLWIIAGTLPIKSSGRKVYATSICYDNKGFQAARYDKIHLFDVRVSDSESHQESATVAAGKDLVVVDTPVGSIGLTVCYDLRFPELYQKLLFKGAEIFSIPAAFTAVTGQAHWELLLRARAVENLCYVLAANQWGHHENGRNTYGHSMMVEPWGQIIAEQDAGTGLLLADLDLPRLRELRQQFPCIQHHVL